MPVTTFKRYEKKFIVTRQQYERMLPVIFEYMYADPYCLDGKSYSLLNIYFDDDTDSIIRQSIRKPRYKEKLRIRSYGVPHSEDSTVFIEIKCKYRGIVTKRRVAFSYKEIKDYLATGIHPPTDNYIYEQVMKEIDSFMRRNPCYPKLFISYDRHAYIMKGDPETRLTFDENILTRRDRLDLTEGNFGEHLIPEDYMIMEIKVPYAIPLWLSKLLSEEGVFLTSFSKYGKEFEIYYKQNNPAAVTAKTIQDGK